MLHVAGRTRGAHAINGTLPPCFMQKADQGAPGANGRSNHSLLVTNDTLVWDLQYDPPRLVADYSQPPPLDVEEMFSSHAFTAWEIQKPSTIQW